MYLTLLNILSGIVLISFEFISKILSALLLINNTDVKPKIIITKLNKFFLM